MIEAVSKSNGVPRARAVCDECGRDEVVPCGYEKSEPNRGQVLRKLTGWVSIKGNLYCPKCEAKRKSENTTKPEPKMTAEIKDIRQPTADQEVDIIVTLSSVYDRKAKRYQGNETDKTVAETIGGIMPGWVAAIREAKFGPSGGNEEIEKIRSEITALNSECAAKVAALNKRIDAVCVAVGPRARSA